MRTRTIEQIPHPQPRRDLVPAFNPDVDQWLRALCGREYPHVEAWLAGLPALADPAPVLCMGGWPGVGKSFLGIALARLWCTGHPVGISRGALHGRDPYRQTPLARCPLAVADEGLGVRAQRLRELATMRTRILVPKGGRRELHLFHPLRVMAINNARKDVPSDIPTIGVQVPRDCPRLFPDVARRWLDEDAVAKHVLWLALDRARPSFDQPFYFGLHVATGPLMCIKTGAADLAPSAISIE